MGSSLTSASGRERSKAPRPEPAVGDIQGSAPVSGRAGRPQGVDCGLRGLARNRTFALGLGAVTRPADLSRGRLRYGQRLHILQHSGAVDVGREPGSDIGWLERPHHVRVEGIFVFLFVVADDRGSGSTCV